MLRCHLSQRLHLFRLFGLQCSFRQMLRCRHLSQRLHLFQHQQLRLLLPLLLPQRQLSQLVHSICWALTVSIAAGVICVVTTLKMGV